MCDKCKLLEGPTGIWQFVGWNPVRDSEFFLCTMLVVTFFLYHFCEMFFKRVASECSFSIVLHLNRFRLAWSRFQFPKSATAVNYPLHLGTEKLIIRQVSR